MEIQKFIKESQICSFGAWYAIIDGKKVALRKGTFGEKNTLTPIPIKVEDSRSEYHWNNPPIDRMKNKKLVVLTEEEQQSLVKIKVVFLKHTPLLYCVDVDVPGINTMDDFIQQTGIRMFENHTWTPGNNKGIHIYVNITDVPQYSNQIKVYKAFDGDLMRQTNVWERIDKKVYGQIQTIPYSQIREILNEDAMNLSTDGQKTKKEKSAPSVASTDPKLSSPSEGDSKAIRIVRLAIEQNLFQRLKGHNIWVNLGYILKNTCGAEAEDLFVALSSHDEKFNEADVRAFFQQLGKTIPQEGKKPLTIATLIKYLKGVAPEEMATILGSKTNVPEEFSWLFGVTYSIAKNFSIEFGDNFLYSRLDECWHYFNGMRWVETKYPLELHRALAEEYPKYLLSLRETITDSEIITRLDEVSHQIDDIVYRKKLVEELVGILSADIPEWELNPYHFCFDNAVFDLRTGERIEATNKADYMRLSTGYNYVAPTAEQRADLQTEIIDKIFPIVEERTCYMTILSTGLYGKTLDRFTMANGSGGNGKNVINDIMLETTGNYGCKMSSAILQNPMKTGPSPETAALFDKRFIVSREPDETRPLTCSTIKELTGGSVICARMCHSNRTKISNKGTYLVEFNPQPQLDGRPDDAMARRLIDVLFRSSFVDELTGAENEFLKNTKYTDKAFQMNTRCAFFHYLLPYFAAFHSSGENMSKFIPKVFQTRMLDFLMGADAIYQFYTERYEQGEPTDYVLLRDFHAEFKFSDIYKNMTREEKRGASEKRTIEGISGNVNFRKIYKKSHRPYVDGVQQNKSNVLLGVRLKLEGSPLTSCKV